MNRKHRATFARIFTHPVSANLNWDDVVAMLTALGASLSEGQGSRVRIELAGQRITMHKPHPQKEMDRGAVVTLRLFLERTGVKPDDE